MSIPESLAAFLQNLAVRYHAQPNQVDSLSEIPLLLDAQPEQVVQPYLLKSDRAAWLMALLPGDRELDLHRIEALLKRKFSVVSEHERIARFPDSGCIGMAHPFAHLYPVPVIIDRGLLESRQLFFAAGSADCVVSVSGEDFFACYQKAPKVVISNRRARVVSHKHQVGETKMDEARWHQIQQRLPAMPAMAGKLIALSQEPDVAIADLAAVIELDPSTAAQVIGYARSPLFGYRGKVDSVEVAITRVLGLERVRKLALAIATTRAFSIPAQGALGLRAYWRHALYAGLLSQALAQKVKDDGVDPNILYLCGLLHNIGVLVLGHAYRGDYKLLSRFLERHPAISLYDAEQRVALAVHGHASAQWPHTYLGARLLSEWHLPEEVITCCEHHHEPAYQGVHASCVRILQLANHLLAQVQIGDQVACDASGFDYPAGLDQDLADEMLKKILLQCHDIDELANTLVA